MFRNRTRECKIKMETRRLLISIWVIVSCDAFAPVAVVHRRTTVGVGLRAAAAASDIDNTAKTNFLDALDRQYDLNKHSETRTNLLNTLIDSSAGFSNPGSVETFASVAPGIWRVVYAPHMTILESIFHGELSVQYDLEEDSTMKSHARYSLPFLHLFGYLSVSGVYGSVNNNVCRVDFDEAWVRSLDDTANSDEGPYFDIANVPNSIWKSLIRNVGRAMFIEPFAVFPVSYLDNELIVFDFELLGTRICARKEKS